MGTPLAAAEVGGQEIRDGILDGVVLLTFGAVKGALDDLLLIFLGDGQLQLPFAHRTGKDIQKALLHRVTFLCAFNYNTLTDGLASAGGCGG